MLLQGLSFWETTPHATFCGLFSLFTSWHLKQNSENIMFPRYYFLQKQNDGSKNSFHRCLWQARQYWVSGLEVYKNTCLCFSTQKLYAIYVFNSVQSNLKTFLCTSVHFNVVRQISKRYSSSCHVFISMWGVISSRSSLSLLCCKSRMCIYGRARTYFWVTLYTVENINCIKLLGTKA